MCSLSECDLIYGHHDGGFFDVSKEHQFDREHWELRMFRHMLLSKPHSPNGVLARYRFQMMDPTDFGAMSYDQPARLVLTMHNTYNRDPRVLL